LNAGRVRQGKASDVMKGMKKGLAQYGDAGFLLFLRKAFIKAMGYSDDARRAIRT
jgi:hypothetical protein